MLRGIDGSADKFLADLERNQTVTDRAQRQVSSGLRIERPSDAPDQIVRLMQLRAEIAQNNRIQTNLTQVTAEVNIGDTAIQNAASLLDRVKTLGAEGATTLSDAQDRQAIAQEVQSIQEQLVSLSRTQAGGRFIFSGDTDQAPPYELNLSAPNGVNRISTASASRQIQDVDGSSFTVGRTAQDIFDHRNADDTTASDNVFAAVNALRTALQNNDAAGIGSSMNSLHTASDYLNVQLGYYGMVQNRISGALDRAAKSALQEKTELGSIQDTDLPAATVAMTQGQIQQQATLAVQSKMPKTSLFDYLA